METFQFSQSFFGFFLVLFFAVFLLALIKKFKTPNKRKRLPPGPPKLPIIGNLHQLAIDEGPLPHHSLTNFSRKYGPIMHLNLGEVSAVVISTCEIAKEVLKIHDPACADRPESIGTEIMWYNYADLAFSPYNNHWKQMRKICVSELLNSQNVRSFGSIRQDETSRLIKSILDHHVSCGDKPVNLTHKIFKFTSSVICRAAFGGVPQDTDMLIKMVKEGVELAGGFELADFFPSYKLLHVISWNKRKLYRMRHKLDKILDAIIDEHKKNNLANMKGGNGEQGDEDIIDVLLRLQEGGKLPLPITNDNIKAIIFDMFSAGTDTSSTTLDWAMAELMRNPRVIRKVQTELRQALKGKKQIEEKDLQNLEYLKLVIKETLRLHPPIPLLPRQCRQEIEANGYKIPVKTKVMVNIWALARDPNYWHEPESFKPERFSNNFVDFRGNNFEFIPFGAGRRICPGLNFGVANVELPLAELLYHFDWKLPEGMTSQDIDMTEAQGAVVSRKTSLCLVPTKYDPAN